MPSAASSNCAASRCSNCSHPEAPRAPVRISGFLPSSMPRKRQELEALEHQNLASYAQCSADSRGRERREAPPEWRTEYQRDRDRVIHSRAFRRLEYKTQVFLNGTGDHLRTRLTHTIEVAAVSRNIARALRLWLLPVLSLTNSSITSRQTARQDSCWQMGVCHRTHPARARFAKRSSKRIWWIAWWHCQVSCFSQHRFRCACGS